jgi:hypothetical protein
MVLGASLDTMKSCYHHIEADEFYKRLYENVFSDTCCPPPTYEGQGEVEEDIEDGQQTFESWLDENVIVAKGKALHLRDVTEGFTGVNNMHSKESSAYRSQVEQWIKKTHKGVKWEYTVNKINDKAYRGWKDITIKATV